MKERKLSASVLATVLNALDSALVETEERIIDGPGLPGGMDAEERELLQRQERNLREAISEIQCMALSYKRDVADAARLTADVYLAQGGVPADHSTWLDDTLQLLTDCDCGKPLRDLVARVYTIHREEFFAALDAEG